MKTKNPSQQDLIAIYKDSNEQGQARLEKIYGKKMFQEPEHDYKSITTFAKVFKYTKPSKEELAIMNYTGTNDRLLGTKGVLELFHVFEAINGGKEHDWENSGTYKYNNVFNMQSGRGFSCSDCDGWHSSSAVGSRLSAIDEPRAAHIAKYFPNSYKLLMQKKHER